MDFSKYLNYSTADFLKDEAFIRYVLAPNEADVAFWEAYLDAYPESTAVFQSASSIVSAYQNQDTFYNEEAEDRVFSRIENTIQTLEAPAPKVFKLHWFGKVAAGFVLLIMFGLLYWMNTAKTNHQTDYGQISTLTLPDGSTVVLNGNSKISYAKDFKNGNREIWLTGEALFKVKHLNIDTNQIKPGEKFIVHCGDLNVEVLGTTFNVKNRRDQTSVGLLNGKIRISYTEGINHQDKQVVLAPGDFLQHSKKEKSRLEKLEAPQKLILWVNHQINFNDATLQDIAQVLEDDFGYKVQLKDESMKKLRIEGEINVANVTDLLHIVSTTLHVEIKKEEKNIFIQP